MEVRFRPIAIAYVSAFFGALAISGIATYTVTNYSPEVDKITLFYGAFNPCIWFDHYPSKIIALLGIGSFVAIGALYSLVLFLWEWRGGNIFKTAWAAFLYTIVLLFDLIFVNVFTTNLYPLEPARRLHGVHWQYDEAKASAFVSLAETDTYAMTEDDYSIVKLHTAFYIAWIVGQIIFTYHLGVTVAWGGFSRRWSRNEKIWVIVEYIVAWYGMVMHVGAMLVIILQSQPKVEWYFKEELAGTIQHLFILIDGYSYTSAWGWIPIMLFRLILPADAGVMVKVGLVKKDPTGNEVVPVDTGALYPETWIHRSLVLLAMIAVMGGVFHSDFQEDTSNSFRICSAMRTKPFAYFAAPLFVLSVLILMLGIGLNLIQRRLMSGEWNPLLTCAGVAWCAAQFTSVLIILPRANFTDYLMGVATAAYFVWILLLNFVDKKTGNIVIAGIYVLVAAGLITGSILTHQWYFDYSYVVLLCLYEQVAPDGTGIRVRIVQLGEASQEEQAKPPGGSSRSYQQLNQTA